MAGRTGSVNEESLVKTNRAKTEQDVTTQLTTESNVRVLVDTRGFTAQRSGRRQTVRVGAERRRCS